MVPVTDASRSLYVHVPFCQSRCTYCDFHSSTPGQHGLASSGKAWLTAIGRHLAFMDKKFGRTGFRTVYVGGGSPSFLPREILEKALHLIGEEARAGGSEPLEWTVEANPEDIDAPLLETLAQAGVDRLSVGVQSLEERARAIAGRRGNAASTMRHLELVAGTWKGRWSADLMYGLPGQSPEGLASDVATLSGLGLGHLSLYELTLEEGTPLWRSAESSEVRIPDDDERGDQYDAARLELAESGFKRYEVSNWSLSGQECMHNDVYWGMGDWLATGPSGVSNIAAEGGAFMRTVNSSDDERYFADPVASSSESLVTGKDAVFECLMTAMRRVQGFGLSSFSECFGLDPTLVFGHIDELFPDLVRLEGGAWRATERGLDTLNIPLLSALSSAEKFFDTPLQHDGETSS